MPSPRRYAYLDGIRAVAILSVIALHWFAWYVPLFDGGVIGVDVFFVLSGFIITTMLWRTPLATSSGRDWLAFVRRRVARLYPALVGLVVGATALYAAVPVSDLGPVEVGRRGLLVLTQSTSLWAAQQDGTFMLPALEPFGHAWSLAVEWYFYLLWPLLLIAARRRGWSARRTAVGAAVLGAVVYVASLGLPAFWFYFGPTPRAGELLAGAALALSLQARGGTRLSVHRSLPVLALVAIAAWVLVGTGGAAPAYRWVGVPLVVTATLVLIAAGYAEERGPVHALLGQRWVAGLGRVSYSLYLWHIVPFLLLADVEGVAKPLVGLAAVGLTVALTAASYWWLERPFLKPRSDVLRPTALSAASASSRSSADARV